MNYRDFNIELEALKKNCFDEETKEEEMFLFNSEELKVYNFNMASLTIWAGLSNGKEFPIWGGYIYHCNDLEADSDPIWVWVNDNNHITTFYVKDIVCLFINTH